MNTSAISAATAGDVDAMVAVFAALSHKVRLAMIAALDEPLTVPELRVHLGITDPERHLAVLRQVGLVEQLGGLTPRPWVRSQAALDSLPTIVGALSDLRRSDP